MRLKRGPFNIFVKMTYEGFRKCEFNIVAPHVEEEVPEVQTAVEEILTLEGQDISPEKMTPEFSEVITIETTREDLKKPETEEVSFEIVAPEKTEISLMEVTVEESPLPDEEKVAPTATVKEVSMVTTEETEEVILTEVTPTEVTTVSTDVELLLPKEELSETKSAPEEEVRQCYKPTEFLDLSRLKTFV